MLGAGSYAGALLEKRDKGRTRLLYRIPEFTSGERKTGASYVETILSLAPKVVAENILIFDRTERIDTPLSVQKLIILGLGAGPP